ncbi:MAG: PIN domain-containing protein [Deltaproteobacteria bacterium]|nr:PIN domain-containing protein [Deltaproteobacteria bacterium]
MKYILDTDTIIYFLKGDKDIVSMFISSNADMLFTTRINYAELIFGAYNSSKIKENLRIIKEFLSKLKIFEFDEDSADIFGKIKSKLRSNGNIIADMDLMVAAISVRNDGMLITNNTRNFKRITELKIDNWKNAKY